jgi:hypothetical protein
MGFCGATGPGEDLGIRFREQPPGVYVLIVEANGGAAGTADVSIVIEGCVPDGDLGTLRRGSTLTGVADTVGAPDLYEAGCAGESGGERVLGFNLAAMADVDLSFDQMGDHVYALYAEVGGFCDETPVACHDPASMPSGMTTFRRLAAGSYLLVVDAFDPGDEGTATVRLTAR